MKSWGKLNGKTTKRAVTSEEASRNLRVVNASNVMNAGCWYNVLRSLVPFEVGELAGIFCN
ncbi:MAG: hypothetical protein ACKERF_02115 [Candidatus Hodgkinia cicadicola]